VDALQVSFQNPPARIPVRNQNGFQDAIGTGNNSAAQARDPEVPWTRQVTRFAINLS
jgi:hypothetical protein